MAMKNRSIPAAKNLYDKAVKFAAGKGVINKAQQFLKHPLTQAGAIMGGIGGLCTTAYALGAVAGPIIVGGAALALTGAVLTTAIKAGKAGRE